MTPSLFDKLRLKGRTEIVILNAPQSFDHELAGLEGITVHRDTSGLEHVDFALAFVTTDAELTSAAAAILPKAQGDPMAWFAYPKLRSKRHRCEFNRDSGWAPILAAGFESARQVALDEDWSVLRFRRIEHAPRMFNPAKLIELRSGREWSQDELADRAGVAQNYVSRLERNRVEGPSMFHLQKIADALQVPLTTLLYPDVHSRGEPAAKNGTAHDLASQLEVFICHASSDKPAARELYQRLKAEGFAPWLDEEDLLPGQNWRKEIARAVAKTHVVIVCLSKTAVTKQGFVQKEIGYALDVASEQPEDTIYIIPVRLEECAVPDRLSEWHWVDLHEPRGYELLLRSLHHRAESL
jgi:transcriptional regulator with XRE-family HTH domain